MSRVSIGERAKLSLLLARRWRRNLLGRLNAHPLVRWRFFSAKTDRLVIAPQDLRTADPTRASEIYSGRFAFAGKVVVCDGRSPFEMAPPSDEWASRLLGFGWLRHLRAMESGITRANARALVDEWMTLQGSWHALAWRPDVLSRRIISWLTQAPLILHDADVRFYRRFLRSLTRQVRFLRYVSVETREGSARLHRDDRARLRGVVHGRTDTAPAQRHQAPVRRIGAANPARRRPYQPQSRRLDRIARSICCRCARPSRLATCNRLRRCSMPSTA